MLLLEMYAKKTKLGHNCHLHQFSKVVSFSISAINTDLKFCLRVNFLLAKISSLK